MLLADAELLSIIIYNNDIRPYTNLLTSFYIHSAMARGRNKEKKVFSLTAQKMQIRRLRLFNLFYDLLCVTHWYTTLTRLKINRLFVLCQLTIELRLTPNSFTCEKAERKCDSIMSQPKCFSRLSGSRVLIYQISFHSFSFGVKIISEIEPERSLFCNNSRLIRSFEWLTFIQHSSFWPRPQSNRRKEDWLSMNFATLPKTARHCERARVRCNVEQK